MKRVTPAMLWLLVLLFGFFASGGERARAGTEEAMPGEQITVTVDFTGDWYLFEEFQFGIMLPSGWRAVQTKDEIYFMAVDETGDRALWMELYQSEGNTMDTVLKDLMELPEFEQVNGIYYNGIPFVTYSANGIKGFATMTSDAQTLLFIKVTPLEDEALISLAEQIMATITPLSQLPQEQ